MEQQPAVRTDDRLAGHAGPEAVDQATARRWRGARRARDARPPRPRARRLPSPRQREPPAGGRRQGLGRRRTPTQPASPRATGTRTGSPAPSAEARRRGRPRSRRPRRSPRPPGRLVSKAVTVARISSASVSQATDSTRTAVGSRGRAEHGQLRLGERPRRQQRRLQQVAVAQHPTAGAGPVAQPVAGAVVRRRQGAGLLVAHGQAVAPAAYVGQRHPVAHAAGRSRPAARPGCRASAAGPRGSTADHDGGRAADGAGASSRQPSSKSTHVTQAEASGGRRAATPAPVTRSLEPPALAGVRGAAPGRRPPAGVVAR